MKKLHKALAIGFVIGFFIACVSLAIKTFSYGNAMPSGITCSADGKYVYIIAGEIFNRSEDYGKTFTRLKSADIIQE